MEVVLKKFLNVSCPKCKRKIDKRKINFEGRPSAIVICKKCNAIFIVVNPVRNV